MVRLSEKSIKNDKYFRNSKHKIIKTLIIVKAVAYVALITFVTDAVARRNTQKQLLTKILKFIRIENMIGLVSQYRKEIGLENKTFD